MPGDEEIPLLCRETQSLRSRAAGLAGQTMLHLCELRQLLAQRSTLLQWNREVKASMPTQETERLPRRPPQPRQEARRRT